MKREDRMKTITAWRVVGAALAFVAMLGFTGMAIAEPTDAEGWSQLGTQQAKRGELDAAIASHQKALKLYEAAGNKKGMAAAYDQLGHVYQTRGDLARAEEMHTKSLKLYEELESVEGMTTEYLALGFVYGGGPGGDLARAVEMCVKAEKLVEKSGNKSAMASVYSAMGFFNMLKRDMDKACPAFRKARALYAELGVTAQVEQLDGALRQNKCPAE
jgi:protein O-GlcNAc transferase